MSDALTKYRQGDGRKNAVAKYLPQPGADLGALRKYLEAAAEGYWNRQGRLAREGLAMAEHGAQAVRGGDPMGAVGMFAGPAGYLASPITALLPTEQEVYNDPSLPQWFKPAAAGTVAAAGFLTPGPKVKGLGKGLGSLADDVTDAERAALQQRLAAEAGQTGGAPSTVGRDQALAKLTESTPEGITPKGMGAPRLIWKPTPDSFANKIERAPDGTLTITGHPSLGIPQDRDVTRALDDFVRPLGDDVFIRSVKSPDDFNYLKAGTHRGSRNWDTGEPEGGLSVARSMEFPGNHTYLVRGKVIGEGTDKEPLLELGSARPASDLMSTEAMQAHYEQALNRRLQDLGISREDWRNYETGGVGKAPSSGITAYHGSPHTFDRFDMGKIRTEADINPNAKVDIGTIFRGVEGGADPNKSLRMFKGGDIGDGVYLTPDANVAKSYGGGPGSSVKEGTRTVHSFKLKAPLYPDDVAYVFGGSKSGEPTRLVTGNGIELWRGTWSGLKSERAGLEDMNRVIEESGVKIVMGTPDSIGLNQIAVRDPSILEFIPETVAK